MKRLILFAFLVLAACSRAPQDKEAIRQAVMHYLGQRSGLDISSMDVEVQSVAFRGNEADAMVTFRAKGTTDPGASMQMRYTLESKEGKWAVKARTGGEESGHGAGGAAGSAGELPPGHPPVTGQTPPSGQRK